MRSLQSHLEVNINILIKRLYLLTKQIWFFHTTFVHMILSWLWNNQFIRWFKFQLVYWCFLRYQHSETNNSGIRCIDCVWIYFSNFISFFLFHSMGKSIAKWEDIYSNGLSVVDCFDGWICITFSYLRILKRNQRVCRICQCRCIRLEWSRWIDSFIQSFFQIKKSKSKLRTNIIFITIPKYTKIWI